MTDGWIMDAFGDGSDLPDDFGHDAPPMTDVARLPKPPAWTEWTEWTDEDVALVKDAIGYFPYEAPFSQAQAVLAALAEAGRLAPLDGER